VLDPSIGGLGEWSCEGDANYELSFSEVAFNCFRAVQAHLAFVRWLGEYGGDTDSTG
jgi:hypothetical protein